MNNKEFLQYMATQNKVKKGTEVFEKFNTQSQEALKITMELNNRYHTPEEIVEIFSKLTDKSGQKLQTISSFLHGLRNKYHSWKKCFY